MDQVGKNGGADSNELLAAQSHIWNHLFNFINSMSLKCAVQLGIPDIIHNHGQPMTLDQLIHALPINHAKSQFVYRLMRILIHSGFFVKVKISQNDDENEGYAYALAPPSKLLLKDNPSSVTPFLLAMLDPLLTDLWHSLSQWFKNNDVNPFFTCHGRPLFELTGQEPRLNRSFNEGMRSDSRLISSVVVERCRDLFLGLNSMVDVGGGTGTLAQAIADAFPDLKCTVLDLHHVVDGLEGSGQQNLAFVGGNMFEAIPPADAVLFKWILHSWSDQECIQLLKKCKEAIPSKEKGGKVIIIDMMVKEDGAAEFFETQIFFDMLMMVNTDGRERNEKEWGKLFLEAGFAEYKITPILGLRALIELYY